MKKSVASSLLTYFGALLLTLSLALLMTWGAGQASTIGPDDGPLLSGAGSPDAVARLITSRRA
jgi:hypothetical protein